MAGPVFKRVSPTELREDGQHYLTGNWMGRPMPVFAGQNLGAVIGSDQVPDPVPVFLQAFHADGQPLTNGVSATIPPGKRLTYDFALPPIHLERLGRITIRATADAAPDQPTELVAQTYPGQWAMFGGNVTNPLPTVSQIEALEVQTGQPLCPDHRRFLQERNGINYAWWHDPVWHTSDRERGDDFFAVLQDAAERLPDIGLLVDAQYVFGAGEGHPYLSYPENLGDFGFYNAAFLRFGIPVGVDAGGNLYVQILAGSRRGEVVFLDHEYHYGILDDADPPQLAPDIRAGAPDKPLEQFTADEFWGHMDAVDYSLPAAPSLDAMLETLNAHHAALIDALAPDWRRG